jgi:uncharacterized protein
VARPARTITWRTSRPENAEQLRDFYEAVAGWTPEPVSMGGYSDYAMNDGDAAAGICHAPRTIT